MIPFCDTLLRQSEGNRRSVCSANYLNAMSLCAVPTLSQSTCLRWNHLCMCVCQCKQNYHLSFDIPRSWGLFGLQDDFQSTNQSRRKERKSSLGQYMLQLALLSEISAVIPFKLNHFNANVLSLNEVQTHQCQQQLQLNPPHTPLGAKFNSRTLQILHIQQPLSIFVIYRDC